MYHNTTIGVKNKIKNLSSNVLTFQIFHVDLWGDDNVILNEDQIVQQLQKVVEMAKTPAQAGIGILTSENRNAWSKAYDILIKGKYDHNVSKVCRMIGY